MAQMSIKGTLAHILQYIKKSVVTVTKSGSAWTAGTVQAWYNSGTVTVQFANVSIGTISTRTTIATIPVGFRPPTEIYTKATNSAYTSTIIVNANGEIKVDSGFSDKTGIYASVTYVTWN